MVTEIVISAVLGAVRFILDMLPTVTVPGWVQPGGVLDLVASVILTKAGAFGYWVSFDDVATVGTLLLGLVGVSLAVRSVRIVISLFTGGGGGAQ